MATDNIVTHLEHTFGKIPILIKDNAKYLSYNDEDDEFNCEPCGKIIRKANTTNKTTRNFEQHFSSCSHQEMYTSYSELESSLSATFSGSIPPIILMNADKLGIDGNNYECVICEKIIMVSKTNTSSTANKFTEHLLSKGHKAKLEDYSQVLSQLYDIYGGISCTIHNNIKFLTTNGKHYSCKICHKFLKVHPTDVSKTEVNFEEHFKSLKHISTAKQKNSFSIIPELKQIFYSLPTYMLKNVDYVSINGLNFFCSLCNINIKFERNDIYKTELNFKLHMKSETHEDKLSARKDQDNDVYVRICELFEGLPVIVTENLKYLTMDDDDDLVCKICDETILNNNFTDYPDETNEYLTDHFESQIHCDMVQQKLSTSEETLEELSDIFGGIPSEIVDNIKHIQYKNGNNFECILCKKILKSKFDSDYDGNTRVTENNFLKHLQSYQHMQELEDLDDEYNVVIKNLGDIYSPIPQFISNNIDHMSYDENNDSFECKICDAHFPVTVNVEHVRHNLQNHFLSKGHIAQLKHKANSIMQASETLENIFGKIPNFLLCDIEHIEKDDNFLNCNLCEVQMWESANELSKHMCGALHKSKLSDLENSNDKVLKELDELFWKVPEFVLKSLDFLTTADDDDLFCILCQEKISIDCDDLEFSLHNLQTHINSDRHEFTFKNL